MKGTFLLLVSFGIFSFCRAQGLGGQTTGGEIVWNDDISLDEIGSSPMLSVSGGDSSYPVHLGSIEGAGGGASGHGSSKSNSEGQVGSSESTKLLRIGSPLSLECKIAHDKDEKLELSWYKNDELISGDDERYKIFANNNTLLISNSNKEDVGVYRCQTVGFTPVKSFNISVVFLYKKDLPKSMTVLEGDKLTISCETEGDPMPVVTWFKDDVNVEEAVNSSRYTLEKNEKGTENATYIVESAAYSDRAEYICYIETGDLLLNTTIFVRVKDMYAALWPFLGICAEVFILCLIIFIYEKRRAKADFEESDTDQPTEQKNTSDHNKDSVRHRK